MDKENNLPDNFQNKYLRIRFSDTPFLFYVANFDIRKVLSENPEWSFKAKQKSGNEELEFLIDSSKKTIKQTEIFKEEKNLIEINSINGDTLELISELKKSLAIYNSFYRFSNEGIYRMEFEQPIPINLPAKEQAELFFKYGYLAECNESFAKMYGYDMAKEIIGKRLVEFQKDPDSIINIEANRAFIESGYSINDIETEEIDKNKNTRYYSNNAVGVIENGCIIRYWGTQIDITERKKIENTLKESEEKYRLLVEYSPDAIIVHSEGKTIYVNNSMVKLMQYKNADEMIGKDVLSFVHNDYKDIVKARIRKSQEEKVYSEPLEEVFIAKGGKLIDVEVTAIPFMFDGIPCTQVVIKDITSRKQDEKIKAAIYKISELAHSIETLDELYKSVHIIVAELMPAKNFYIALYDELTELISFPYFVDEIDEKPNPKKFGKGLTEYVIKTGKPLLADPSVFNKLIEKNEVESIGAESLDWLGVPLIIKGKVIGVVVVQSYDKGLRYKKPELNILNFISEQIGMSISAKKSEKELMQAKNSAEEASKLKSTLLSNMSHELRTPMNGILGFTEIIIEEAQDGFIKELAQYIQVSGKRLMKTLNSIMDLSQLESGQAIINFEEFDLIEEIQIVIKSFIPIANQKNLYLNFVHPLPSIKIYSDRNIIQQIVSNLIDNALKFTSTGGVTVETNIISTSENKIIDIKITDSGIGIAKEFKDHIFKEFRQVSEGLKRNYEGSGLGLSLTKKMVNLLKGRIIFESMPGKGSIFNVILPVQNVTKAEAKVAEEKIEIEYVNVAPQGIPPDLPHILLVEDNEISIKLTEQFLSKTCRMDSSSVPEEVLKMVQNKKYDLILMDINLGGDEDGLHLTKRIRDMRGYENTPIIAVTGYSLGGDKERMIEGGCTDYIKKPFEKSRLLEVIHKNLKKPGSPQK